MNAKTTSLIVALMFALCQLVLAQSTQVTLQPGPEGKDLWITDTYSYNSDYGVDDDKLQVGGWGDKYYSLIQFDLANGPVNADSATLYLYSFASPNDGTYISMYLDRVTQPWNEDTGWYSRPASVEMSIIPAPVPGQWYPINVTSLYNNWKKGLYPNYGIQLRPTQWCCRDSANFRSSDYSNAAYRPKLVIIPSLIALTFPLPNLTPYTARVSAILDHSGSFYTQDKKVISYDPNQVGDSKETCYSVGTNTCALHGYMRSDGKPFNLPLLNYHDDIANSDKKVLWYDGHSGYDYPTTSGTQVRAANSGTLCVSTSNTASNIIPWAQRSKCPYANDPINGFLPNTTSWDRWHVFYIYDSATGYSTWYLHCDSLDSKVLSDISRQGYSQVTQGQVVGRSGTWGGVGPHLHFEVRRYGAAQANSVDPYGNGSTGILWSDKPSQ
jgi:hypothetical protein